MSQRNLPVKLVEWGLANRFDDCIEIHQDLATDPYYKSLYEGILKHEYDHTDGGFSFKDLMHDFRRNPDINYFKLLGFMAVRPKTWLQFLPIYYNKQRGIVYDVNHMLIYLFIALTIILCLKLWPYLLLFLS